MAKNNLVILAGALLLVFLISYGITFTEGRVLKADHVDGPAGNHVTVVVRNQKTNWSRDILEDGSDNAVPNRTSASNNVTDADDFRPTTPGHSPGAGHSTGPTSETTSEDNN